MLPGCDDRAHAGGVRAYDAFGVFGTTLTENIGVSHSQCPENGVDISKRVAATGRGAILLQATLKNSLENSLGPWVHLS